MIVYHTVVSPRLHYEPVARHGSIEQECGLHLVDSGELGRACVGEGNLTAVQGFQSVIGNRDAVRVSAEIVEDALWTTEGRLGINHPFAFAHSLEEDRKVRGLFQAAQFTEELQFAVPVRLFQIS